MGATPKCSPSYAILRVHTCLPFAARNLGGSIWEAVDGGVTRGNLQPLRVDIVREAANEGGLSCNSELHCALGQSRLGILTVGDVARQPLVAFLECCLFMPSLGEKGGKQERTG